MEIPIIWKVCSLLNLTLGIGLMTAGSVYYGDCPVHDFIPLYLILMGLACILQSAVGHLPALDVLYHLLALFKFSLVISAAAIIFPIVVKVEGDFREVDCKPVLFYMTFGHVVGLLTIYVSSLILCLWFCCLGTLAVAIKAIIPII